MIIDYYIIYIFINDLDCLFLMFPLRIECSNSAYKRLQDARINARAKKVKESLTKIFLYRTIWEGRANKILEDAKNGKFDENEQRDILSLEKEVEGGLVFRFEEPAIKHPFLVARVVFGDELECFAKYGFTSKESFAKAITGYCIGEDVRSQPDFRKCVWRQGDYKNEVKLIDHGDMSVGQTNVSGENPEDDSGILINPPHAGFGLEQDWSPFLITVLKYAEALKKQNIPEIKNWAELARKLRIHNMWGGNEFVENSGELDSHYEMFFQRELFGFGKDALRVYIKDGIIPVFDSGNLDILREDKNGSIELNMYGSLERFTKLARYVPEDISHLLKANYQLFVRSPQTMADIMNYFIRQQK